MNSPQEQKIVRSEILTAMRVRGSQTPYPPKITAAPEILKLVDEETVQKIYSSILHELGH